LEELLTRASKAADTAEVYRVVSHETQVQFEANRLKHIKQRDKHLTALRVISNGRIGYAVSTTPSRSEDLVEMALETARFGQKSCFQLPKQHTISHINIYDSNVNQVPLKHMVELGDTMIERIKAFNTDIICEASVSKVTSSTSLLNSNGFSSTYQSSAFSLGIEGTLTRGTDMLFVGDSDISSNVLSNSDTVIETTLQQLNNARETAPIATKTMPVIFTPFGVASSFLSSLMVAFNGKLVLEGASPICNKLKKHVFHKSLSLSDNPLIPLNPSSSPFDDEGVPCHHTPLITKGIVSNFLYDLKTAGQARQQSTGSGRRGGGNPPSPSPSCFVIEKGTTSLNEMIGEIKEGLVVEYLMGAEQGNVLGGDFSGNVLLGYKIDNGTISGRVKNTMVSGNIYAILGDAVSIGSDVRRVGSSLITPSIYCPSVSVASNNK